MRSGLLFKLAIRKPNIFLNQKNLFNFTFLESEHLEDQIKQNPNTQQHQRISQFLKTPFSSQELPYASFLDSKVAQHIDYSHKIRQSLRNNKSQLIENIGKLAYMNILDIDSWREVFINVLQERYLELEDHPHLDQTFKHLENFFSRFDIKNSKFYLDKAQLPYLIPMKENMTSIFNIKKQLGSIKLETSIMNFFLKASSKVPVNIERMRLYYKQHMIDNLKEVLKKENNIVDLAKLEVTLDAIHLAKNGIKDIFTSRVKELLKEHKPQFKDSREHLIIATNWACVGEMRDEYKSIFPDTFQCLLQDSPAALLQAVVTCHKETPENIDRILGVLSQKPFDLVSRKPEIHRVLHILQIRGFDLSKYQAFVDKICDQNCERISPTIAKYLPRKVYSNCMKFQKLHDTTSYSPNLEHKWISHILKNEFRNMNSITVFYQTKICRFDVLFGFIKNNQIYVVEIPDLNMVINKARNYKGTIDQKRQLFKYYNINVLELNLPYKHLSYIVNKKDKHMLVKEVKNLIQNI